MLDLGANVQAATDMARFRHMQVPNTLTMESQLFELVGAQLRRWAQRARRSTASDVGGYQAIMFTPDDSGAGQRAGPVRGFYRAGSDHRKDGAAAGVLGRSPRCRAAVERHTCITCRRRATKDRAEGARHTPLPAHEQTWRNHGERVGSRRVAT